MSLDKIKVELGMIKGYVEDLKSKVSQEKLERFSQRRILIELKSSLERLRQSFLNEVRTLCRQLKPSNVLEMLLLAGVFPN